MNQSLRIAIAEDERDMREYLEQTLPLLGHTVVGSACNGRELIDLCRKSQPELVITDIKMPELDGLGAIETITRERPVPVILISALHDVETIQRAEDNPVLAYLVKPIKEADLAPAIALAMQRFQRIDSLSREAAELRQALEDRKIIERAKAIIMRRANLSEEEAFRRLRKVSSDRRVKLVEIAQTIIATEEALSTQDS
jgi:response regulator NasT